MSRVLLAVLALLAGCAAPARAEAGTLEAVFNEASVPELPAVLRVAVVGIAAGEGADDERRSGAERHDAVAAAVKRWSGGRVTVGVTRLADLDVQIPGDAWCDRVRVVAIVRGAMATRGRDPRRFDHIMVEALGSGPDCGPYVGRAGRHDSVVWVVQPRFEMHELLHAWLGHAHALRCVDAVGGPVPLGVHCTLGYQEDPFSVMGAGDFDRLGAAELARLGWLPRDAVVSAHSGTVELSCERGRRLLRVPWRNGLELAIEPACREWAAEHVLIRIGKPHAKPMLLLTARPDHGDMLEAPFGPGMPLVAPGVTVTAGPGSDGRVRVTVTRTAADTGAIQVKVPPGFTPGG